MTNVNRIGLTWVSFLSYALTGALVIVTGIVMGEMAQYFNVPVARISNIFTFLNAGILVAIFLNAWLMEIISLRRQLIFGFILMLLALLGLITGHSLSLLSACFFILGVVSGITMSIGTFLITHLYAGRQRGSRLLFTDSFFSMAGMLFPIIAATIVANHFSWYLVYCCIGLIYLAIFILTLQLEFPVLTRSNKQNEKATNQKWGLCVFILALAALCYILGQLGFISWIPKYATDNLGYQIEQSGQLVSNFWTAYMVGMWVFSYILKLIDLQKILVILTAVSSLFIFYFTHTENKQLLTLLMIGLGFFSSAIYTTIITLASQQTRVSSPKLVNFILTCGTVGTLLTFIVTGPIVDKGGPLAALHTANGLYFTVFILCLIAGFISRHKEYQQKN